MRTADPSAHARNNPVRGGLRQGGQTKQLWPFGRKAEENCCSFKYILAVPGMLISGSYPKWSASISKMGSFRNEALSGG